MNKQRCTNMNWTRGCIAHIRASHITVLGSIRSLVKIYFDVTEIYRWRWLVESGQRLDKVNQTHLVLACTTKTCIVQVGFILKKIGKKLSDV